MSINENDYKTAINLNMFLAKHLETKNISKAQFLKALEWTEGNFNQYLMAKVRIGDKALKILSKHLECEPENIRHL